MQNQKISRKGFTLIELLIVVAIIAILAAIAVPNFLEAQVRAKVSRAKSDIRSIATAIEAYTVDYNKPPREWDQAVDGPLQGSTSASGIMSPVLSTPVAYMSTAILYDPFVQRGENLPEDEKTFSYANTIERLNSPGPQYFFGSPLSLFDVKEEVVNEYGSWYMFSLGPDRRYDNNLQFNPTGSQIQRAGIVGREYIIYDPTNGTVSAGNIMRSQKYSDDYQSNNPNILGAH